MEEPEEDNCKVCGGLIYLIDCPTGNWWAHHVHPSNDHDAVPMRGNHGKTP
jgi:hypothetical protein